MKKSVLLFVLSFVLMASCESGKYVLTENGRFAIQQIEGYYRPDTISNVFELYVEFEKLYLTHKWNIVPTANAFSKDPGICLNSINTVSVEVFLDRPLVKDGVTIPVGENIIKDILPNKTNRGYGYDESVLRIVFDGETLSNMQFEKGFTNFTLTGKNSDNVRFTFAKKVFMDL